MSLSENFQQENDSVKSVSYDPKKRPNHQNMKEQLYENGALFASTLSAFKKSNCRISGKIGFYKMPIKTKVFNVTLQKSNETRCSLVFMN